MQKTTDKDEKNIPSRKLCVINKDMQLSQEERIKRADKIREDRKSDEIENTKVYLEGNSFKIKRVLTLFIVSYILISFVPFYPHALRDEQIVTFNDYYIAHGSGRTVHVSRPIIKISTNKTNNYEIQGSAIGNHAIRNGDTIITYKNILCKTTLIYNKKYRSFYPLDTHFELLILLSITSIALIILFFIKSYKAEMIYNVMTGTALIVLLIYLLN